MKHRPLQPTTYNLQPTQKGQAMLIATVFFLAIATSIMLGTANPVLEQSRISDSFINSRQSYSISESGLEDVLYRLKKGMQVSSVEVLSAASSTATTTITNMGSNEKLVTAEGDSNNRIRKSEASVTITSGNSFSYGVQVGDGGFKMENNSIVNGNIYSNGQVEGENSNLVKGDVVSAGPLGVVDGIHATSSVYAHTIRNSTIDKDAYYQSISGTIVSGASHPGSADLPKIALPISDDSIAQMENEAAGGGTINSPCPYKINSNATIGPVKINCDFEIYGTPTITLTGSIWVLGNIKISNGPTVKVSSSLGGRSVALVADNPNNRTTSSKIDLNNTAVFQGSGSPGSYVMMLSRNNSAEGGGNEEAIYVDNSASGDFVAYAGHGKVLIANSVSLKEVTAYRVHLKNSASVTYETGLANLLFTSGPSGAWSVGGWKEVE